jgi:iron(III) transport system permease protein
LFSFNFLNYLFFLSIPSVSTSNSDPLTEMPALIRADSSMKTGLRVQRWFLSRRLDARSGFLLLSVLIICGLLLLPIGGLLLSAFKADSGATLKHLFSTVVPRYTLNTVALVMVVLSVVALLGVGTAWLTACYRFPGHRFLSWMLVLPLAMPSFVMAYAYTDLLDVAGPVQSFLREMMGLSVGQLWFPQVRSVPGAGFMLGFALYPYVYIVARQAFEERSASAIEAAKTLGLNNWQIWSGVVWPMARPAIIAGATLVVMETVADFGAVGYFAIDTFTTGIYKAWLSMGDKVAAIQLSLSLLAVLGCFVWLERKQRQAVQTYSRNVRKVMPIQLEGLRGFACTCVCFLPFLLGFFIPVVLLIKVASRAERIFDPRIFDWVVNGLVLAGAASVIILLLAIFLSYANRLLQSGFARFVAGMAQGGYALPGLVIAVGLLTTTAYVAPFLSGSVLILIFAYSVRFLAVGYQSIDAALNRISPAMDASARSLGRGVIGVWIDVHWPLLRRAIFGGFLLVFIDSFKELQTTLVLRPMNFDTLVVIAYQFASDERLSDAAVPSLMIVSIGVIPVLLLWRAGSRR